MLEKSSRVELTIENLAYGGKGVARLGGFVVFVDGAVPGDRVAARIVRKKSDFAEAVIEEVIEPSPHRVEPPCPLFGACGGCSALHLAYEEQLNQKANQVREALARIGRQSDLQIAPIRPSPVIHRYRNKMDFTFGTNSDGQLAIGLHRRGEYAGIVDVERCWLQPERFDRAVAVVRDFARRSSLPAYSQRTHKGFWRHLILRHSVAEDRILIVLITTPGELAGLDRLVEELAAAAARPAGLVWAINDSVADVAACQEVRFQWGEQVLQERVGRLQFRVSPMSFFQVNTRATEGLHDCVVEFAEPNSATTLLDAYCGTGSIGICCASQFARVIGIESVRESVWNARENAALNGLTNCTFLCGPVNRTVALARSFAGGRFGRVVVDPPRGGMDKRALAQLLDLRPNVMVYVSCNPATLARDVLAISEAGYEIERVQPFDLFPHTPHVEMVIKFVRKGGVNNPVGSAKSKTRELARGSFGAGGSSAVGGRTPGE
jgi:23S rRNA (uracil1939-C5)-methyltransferase